MRATQPYTPLSKREYEILNLLVQNLSDREIASRLYVAYTTVKWYNRQIFNKLGVENRQQAAERAIFLGLVEPPTTHPVAKQDLPAPITPFVGRISEIGDLIQLIYDPSIRLITLLAPGGMGKTRLALQVADAVKAEFSEGVCFVAFTSVTSLDYALTALADSIGLHFAQDGRPLRQQLLDFLQRKHLLLVLDNFEHLLESASFVPTLLSRAPHVKVLITSREKLNVSGETIYRINGMSYPDRTEQENIRDYAAVELFLQSAFRASPHFVADDEQGLVRICQLVQGMPLAIELAASWVSTLPLAAIAAEINRSIDFLQTTTRDVPERLRSVRAVFDATWLKLTADEQRVFRRLSVFRGGFTRDAAEPVAGANLNVLASFVAKALLWYKPESARYEIHELLRQYAVEQLRQSGETEQTEKQHLLYFGQFSRAWGKALKTPKQLTALDMLEVDYENVRVAFERAIATSQAEILEPFAELWYFYEIRGRFPEGVEIWGAAIEALAPEESLVLGKLLAGQALFFVRFGWIEQCHASAEKSVAILRGLGAFHELPMPMMVFGNAIEVIQGLEYALAIYHDAFALAQQYHDEWAESCIRYLFGLTAFQQQRFDEAKVSLTQAHALMKEAGNIWGVSFALAVLGDLAFTTGNYGEAKRLYEDVLLYARKVRQSPRISGALRGLCMLAILQDDLTTAKYLAEDMLKIDRDAGLPLEIFLGSLLLAQIAIDLGNIAEARQAVQDALDLSRDIDDTAILYLLLVAAELYLHTHRNEQAVEIASFVEGDSRRSIFDQSDVKRLDNILTQGKASLSDDRFSAARAHGQTLSRESILATLLLNL